MIVPTFRATGKWKLIYAFSQSTYILASTIVLGVHTVCVSSFFTYLYLSCRRKQQARKQSCGWWWWEISSQHVGVSTISWLDDGLLYFVLIEWLIDVIIYRASWGSEVRYTYSLCCGSYIPPECALIELDNFVLTRIAVVSFLDAPYHVFLPLKKSSVQALRCVFYGHLQNYLKNPN